MEEIEIRELCDSRDRPIFTQWLNELDSKAAIKITTAVNRLAWGHSSNVKSVGAGVFEYKVDCGPGYRVYYGKEGNTVIILLGGGTKKGQQKDIAASKELWQQYKKLKQK